MLRRVRRLPGREGCATAQRPAEMGIVNLIIRAVLSAGFEGAEAARVYRAIGDFALSWAGFEAAVRTPPLRVRVRTRMDGGCRTTLSPESAPSGHRVIRN
jgi:hypothetical protein